MNIYVRQQAKDLCKYLNNDQLNLLMALVHTQDYPPSSPLYHAGDKPEEMYVLLEGELAQIDESSSQIISKIYQGEMMNEIHYIRKIPAPFALVTIKACKIAKLSFSDLDQLCASDPDISARIQAAINDSLCLKTIRLTHRGNK